MNRYELDADWEDYDPYESDADWEDITPGGAVDVEDAGFQADAGERPGGWLQAAKGLLVAPVVLKEQLGAKALQLYRGSEIDTEDDWKDKYIREAAENLKGYIHEYGGPEDDPSSFLGIKPRHVAESVGNLAYSGISASAGLAVGGATSLIPRVGKHLSYPAGGAASGVAAYRMAKDEIMQSYYDSVQEEAMERAGRPLNEEEWQQAKEMFESQATQYGLWEAVPEALGNVVGFRLLTAPLKKLVGTKIASKMAGKLSGSFLGKAAGVAGRGAGVLGEELATETITQAGLPGAEPGGKWRGQAGVEARAGLREKDIGVVEGFKEIYGPTVMTTMMMGPLAKGAHSGFSAVRKGLASDEKNILDSGEGLLTREESQRAKYLDQLTTGIDSGEIDIDHVQALREKLDDADPLAQMLDDVFLQPSQFGPDPAYADPQTADFEARLRNQAIINKTMREQAEAEEAQAVVADQIEAQAEWEDISPGQAGLYVEPSQAPDLGTPVDMSAFEQVPPKGLMAPEQLEEARRGVRYERGMQVEPSQAPDRATAVDMSGFDRKAHEAATSPLNDLPEPTQAQKEAGNYKKAHVNVQGFDITIENPEGSVRTGTAPDGTEWQTEMTHHYGYFKRSEGKDGDQIDVFVGPNPESETAYIVDQIAPETGKFDEHKVLMGFESLEDAEEGYLSNYEEGWQGIGNITEVPIDELKKFVEGGKQTKPYTPFEMEERRKDIEKRKRIDKMTPVEMRKELMTDFLTGLGNKRALSEAKPKPAMSSIDMDSLGYVNDTYGHDAGDAALKLMGDALKNTDAVRDTYHVSGDEFIIQGETEKEVDAAIQRAYEYLKKNPLEIEHEDGSVDVIPISFSYGKGETYETADKRLLVHKKAREARGERSPTKVEPPGVFKKPARGVEAEDRGEGVPETEVTPEVKKESWEMTREEHKVHVIKTQPNAESYSEVIRIDAIKKALSEGKPVPEEVLKDYPDLKPAEEKPKVEIVPYLKDMDIRNTENLPRGVGARYLEVIKGEDGEYIAKKWRRKPIEKGILIDFEAGKEAVPFTEKPPKTRKAPVRGAGVRTLRGRIKMMGGINFLNFTGELRNLPTSVRFLANKKGFPIDLAEETLKAEGWLAENEDLLDLLRDPEVLKRDNLRRDMEEKKPHELAPEEKRIKKEMEHEPEAPPEGEYVQMKAEDLPEGKEMTIIEGDTVDGWDVYEVVEKDQFGITLQDGTTIELAPLDVVEVLKSDIEETEIIPPTGEVAQEVDIFGKSLPGQKEMFDIPKGPKPEKKKRVKKEKLEKSQTQLDLFTGEGEQIQIQLFDTFVKGEKPKLEEVKPGSIPVEHQRTRMQTTGYIKAAGNLVRNVDEAVSLLSHIRKSAQEDIYGITVDKNGVVLEIHRYGKGTMGAGKVSVIEFAGHVLNTPDAAFFFFAHNHPGGSVTPSSHDNAIAEEIENLLSLKNIKTHALIIAENKYFEFTGTNALLGGSKKINPVLRKVDLPVKERVYGHRKLGPVVSDSEKAKARFKDEYGNAEGFIFLDAGLHEVGFLPFVPGGSMRDMTTAIISQAERVNATGFIFNSTKPFMANQKRVRYFKNLATVLEYSLQIFDISDQGKSLADDGTMNNFQGPSSWREIKSEAPLFSIKEKAGKKDIALSREEVEALRKAKPDTLKTIEGRGHRNNITRLFKSKGFKNPDAFRVIKPETDEQKQIVKIAKELGLKAVFFDIFDPQIGVNGVIDAKAPNVVYLNTKPKNKSVLMVAGHEVLHTLKAKHPEVYEFLKSALIKNKAIGFDEYLKRINEQRAKVLPDYKPMKAEEVFDEFMADFAGEQWADPEFWKILANENPTLAQKVMEIVREVLDKIISYLTDNNLKGKYFEDIKAAQKNLAVAMREYVERTEAGTTKKVPSMGELKFQVSSIKPWPKNFPNAVPHTTLTKLTSHPDYEAAKSGDVEAAIRLVDDLINVSKAKELAEKYPDAVIVPVHAQEEAGLNKIPAAFAQVLSDISRLSVEDNIIQSNLTGHTKKKGLTRLLSRAIFTGEIKHGQKYILVDDAIAQGGTIHELRHYIDNNNGETVAVVTLGFGKGATVVAVRPETIQKIEGKFGREEIEKFLYEYNIAGSLDAITEGEGRYLLSYSSIESLRNRLLEEGFETDLEAGQRPLQTPQVTPLFSLAEQPKTQAELDKWANQFLDKYTKDIPVKARDYKPPPSMFEKFKDDWFSEKDWSVQKNSVEAKKLQDAIKETLGEKRYTQKCKDADKAIHVYLDLKRNPDHLDEYYGDLNPEQQKIVDLAQTIESNPKLKAIADYIANEYEKTGLHALDAGIIHNVLDNYAARAWRIPRKFSTDNLQKFKTTSRHAKQRVFETILEGQSIGFELQVEGATNNLSLLKDEISRTIEDKRLVKKMIASKDEDGNPLIVERMIGGYQAIDHPNFTYWGPAVYVKEGEIRTYGPGHLVESKYGVIKEGNERASHLFDSKEEAHQFISMEENPREWRVASRHTVREKKQLYAPIEMAKSLNRILGVSKLKGAVEIGGVSMVDVLTKYNAVFKAWILITSFFHHLAFMRSYLMGTRRKTLAEWSPRQAYKKGLEAINEMKPEIELLVRNGLTLGRMQDWEESILRNEQTIFGKAIDKLGPVPKAFKDWINNLRERQADFLFRSFGAGLKAQAGLIEYRNALKEHPEMEPNDRAKMVAKLINDDFGGLHLGRMDRDPTIQHIFRLLALAPDWSESNVRTMFKAFVSGGKEERQLYRRFWASVITKGFVATLLANILLGIGDDEDLLDKFKRAWKEGNFRWLDVDITRIYKLLGGKTEARKYFSIVGHFKDPIKFVRYTGRSMKHKGSVVSRMFFEAYGGTDWRGQRFTTLSELIGVDDKGVYVTTVKGKHKAGEPKGGKLAGRLTTYGKTGTIDWEQVPSYLGSQLRGIQPIQVQNLISYITGEVEGFDAVARSLGLHTSSTYPTERSILKDFAEQYVKIRNNGRNLAPLKKAVKEYNERQEDLDDGVKIPWLKIVRKGNRLRKVERTNIK